MASASVESVKEHQYLFFNAPFVKAQQISLLLQIAHQSQYEMDKGYRKGARPSRKNSGEKIILSV